MSGLEREIAFTLNGKATVTAADPVRRLADVLRRDLGLTGTKIGCDAAIAAPARCCSTAPTSAPA